MGWAKIWLIVALGLLTLTATAAALGRAAAAGLSGQPHRAATKTAQDYYRQGLRRLQQGNYFTAIVAHGTSASRHQTPL